MGYSPENNPTIPGDPYSYDLNWIVARLEEAISLYQPLNDKFEDLYNYVHDYFEGADFEALVDSALHVMADDGTLASIIQPLFDEYKIEIDDDFAEFKRQVYDALDNEDDRIAVLESRMDTFTNLPDASTAGDAELQDIRVGADGHIWPTAGDAVRGQISALDTQIETFFDDLFYETIIPWKVNTSYPTGWRTGYFAGNVGEERTIVNSNNYMRAHFALSQTGYPEIGTAIYIRITPPAGYGVSITETAQDNTVISRRGTINVESYPEAAGVPVIMPYHRGNLYLISLGKFSGTAQTFADDLAFCNSIVMEFVYDNHIINRFKPRTGEYEFFSVEVDRPLSFGGEEKTATQDSVECVLRLPVSYNRDGTPTRLVLMCHGASGYVDAANSTWYNPSWKLFCDDLLAAGYALFDSNVLPTSTGTAQMGYAMGSALYVNVLKKAYDYIIDNYNVFPQIFAHGSSMGGLGADAFVNAYPQLVLAQSSFAGRDIIKYIDQIATEALTPADLDKFAIAWGYPTLQDLKDDHFSHIHGVFGSLSIMNLNNGIISVPPLRDANFDEWMAYFGQIANLSRLDDAGIWIGKRTVPYKAWNSWTDSPTFIKIQEILEQAYQRGNSAEYTGVYYESGSHSDISYGNINDMRDQLIAWFKRWE